MRIAFIGEAGCGKSTAANYLVELAKGSEEGEPYFMLHFATALKDLVRQFLGRPIDKATDREFMQALGSALRICDLDYFINPLGCRLQKLEEEGYGDNIVVDDCRFLNEAAFLRKHGFLLIRIVGGSSLRLSACESSHQSETEQRQIQCDHEMQRGANIESFQKNLRKVFESIKKSPVHTYVQKR